MLQGSPWGYTHFHCHQMMAQHRPEGPQGCRTSPNNRHLSATPCRPKNSQMLTSEADLGNPEIAPGTPFIG